MLKGNIYLDIKSKPPMKYDEESSKASANTSYEEAVSEANFSRKVMRLALKMFYCLSKPLGL